MHRICSLLVACASASCASTVGPPAGPAGLGSLAASPAQAGAAQDLADNLGWFGGVAVGTSTFSGYELEDVSDDLDDEDVGWMGYAGYQFHPFWAVAIGYVDLGTLDASGSAFGGFEDEISDSGFTLSGVGILPVANDVALYGALGAHFWQQEVDYVDGGGPFSEDASGVSPMFGAGANWFVDSTENVGVNLNVHYFPNVGDEGETGHENDLTLVTVGVLLQQ